MGRNNHGCSLASGSICSSGARVLPTGVDIHDVGLKFFENLREFILPAGDFRVGYRVFYFDLVKQMVGE